MAARRSAGEHPYLPTEAKTGGFACPADKKLPTHLVNGRKTRLVLLYRLNCQEPPPFACPSGCEIVSPMAAAQADVFIVEDLSNMDLKMQEDTNLVLDLVLVIENALSTRCSECWGVH